MTEALAAAYQEGFAAGRASVLGTNLPAFFEAVIPGSPVPKERPRTVVNAKGGAHTYTPERTATWERRATAFFLKSGAKDVDPSLTAPGRPLLLGLETAGRASPDGVVRYDTGRPDIDNLCKIAMDSLAPSRKRKKVWTRVLSDDANICGIFAIKRTLAKGEEPFVRVRLFSLPDVVHEVP